MPEQTDPNFLANEEYPDASALGKRIRIQELYRTHPQNWFEWIFDRLNLPPEAHILELGCGPGDLWLKNRTRLPADWELVLSDLSAGMLADARLRLGRAGLTDRLQWAAVDLQAIPFQNGAFEAVIGNGVLDHVPDRVRALDEIQRVLKPRGRFFTTTGSRTHLQEIEALVRPFLPEADFGGDPGRFGLENGSTLLSPWFKDITLERYSDELVFQEPEPVIAYILSEAQVSAALGEAQRETLRLFIENELAVRQKLKVTNEKGMFIARLSNSTGALEGDQSGA